MQDGSMYFQVLYKNELIHYFQETGRFDRVEVPLKGILESEAIQELPIGSANLYHLFVDHTDRLWFHDYGWLEPDGTWYQIIRSPVFISEGMQDYIRYSWERPDIVIESLDGLLWFRFTMGLVRLDPRTAKWCWFTTYPSNIVEDQDHTLWMIADGKLYRYQLEP